MKTSLLIFLVTLVSFNAFTQNFKWAKGLGESGAERGNSLAVDAAGNVYTTGYFHGSMDFDPGEGVFTMTTPDGDQDVFILKLDAAGNFVWAKRFLGAFSTADGLSITLDAKGNIYTCGYYTSQIDCDPGPAAFTLTSAGKSDIFISKLTSAGDFIWAKSIGGAGLEYGYSVAVDATGNVYTTGSVQAEVDFDPGPGTFRLNAGLGTDVFISKLNSSGEFVWARDIGGAGVDQGNAIALDIFGNIFITGYYAGIVDFNPSDVGIFNMTSAGGNDIFICKLNAAGSFLWAKSTGSLGSDQGNAIVTDAKGNVYTTGFFNATVDFDPGAASYNLTTKGFGDIFISKLDSSGSFIWAQGMGALSQDIGSSIALDVSGNVYTTGYFSDAVDFDAGAGTHILTPEGFYNDVFVLKLDVDGNFILAKNMGGMDYDEGYSIAVSKLGVYITGYFQTTADFDPGPATFDLVSNGYFDIFIVKLSLDVLPVTLLSFDAAILKSDVSLTWKTATEANNDKFEIEKSKDGILFNYTGQVKAAGNSSTVKVYSFTDKNAFATLPRQRLYYRLKQKDIDGHFTYSATRVVTLLAVPARVQIYPNPSADVIAIKASAAQLGQAFSIADGTGKQVFTGKLKSETTSVNIKHLPAGMYFVKIGTAGKETIKIMKQ